MHSVVHVRRHQQGAVIITVCLFLLFLLGFMGIALDFGRLFIVKTELQTAMDSCALAAAQELDLQATAIDRARSAGKTAGNLNRVNLQSATWDGKGQIVDADITFRDAGYADTTDPTQAKYVECRHTQPSVRLWLLHALGAFYDGNTSRFPATQNVAALAVATRGSSQTSCPIPIALRPKTPGAPPPNFGYTRGEWITLLMAPGTVPSGYIGWANLDGSNSASETERELTGGNCGTRVGDSLGTPGVQASVADVWNARFGLYRGSSSPATMHPDFTGYSYTTNNWPSGNSAYDGPTPPMAHPTADDFLTKRLAFASCADTGTQMNGPNGCATIINRTVNSFNNIASPGPTATDGHARYGANRRIVTVPVTNAYPGSVEDYACMLMLQPISLPPADIQLEFIGGASVPGSPCATSGLPGGAAGPLVPVLVR
jgi:Flp pilus assembly protein TadG